MIGVAGSRKTVLISLAIALAIALSMVFAVSYANRAQAYPAGWTVQSRFGPDTGTISSVSMDAWADYVWVTWRGGPSQHAIGVQTSSDKGATWSAPFYLEDGTYSTDEPFVIMGTNRGDGTPRVFVIYGSKRDGLTPTLGRYQTWIARSEDYGSTWDGYAARWHTATNADHRLNHRADRFPGSNRIGWIHEKPIGAGNITEAFYGGVIKTDGAVEFYDKRVSPDDGLHSYEPDIACSGFNQAMVVWTNQDGGGYAKANIRYQYTADYGQNWGLYGSGTSPVVGYDAGYRHSNPSIEWDTNNPVLVCSLERPSPQNWWVNRYYFIFGPNEWGPTTVELAKLFDTKLSRPYPHVYGPKDYDFTFYRYAGEHLALGKGDKFEINTTFLGAKEIDDSVNAISCPGQHADRCVAALTEGGEGYFRRRDNVPPPTAVITKPDPGEGTLYYNKNFEINATAVDDFVATTQELADGKNIHSGIESVAYKYSEDGSTWTDLPTTEGGNVAVVPPYKRTAKAVDIGQKRFKLKMIATDSAGNTKEAESVGWVVIDYTDPVTSATYDPPNPTGFYNSGVEVALDMTDVNPKECFYRIYKVGNSPGAWQVYTSPFIVSGDNNWRVQYYSDDLAGNIDSTHIFTVNIDTTLPVTSLSTDTTPNANGWRNADTQVMLSVDEVNFDFTRCRINAGMWQTYGSPFLLNNGVYNVEYYSHDLAGNTETIKSGIVRVDTDRPVTSLSTDTTPNGEGWRDSNTTVILAPSDAMSGTAETKYTINGESEQVYSSSFTLKDGIWNVEYWSVDLAGNAEARKSGTIRVDTVDPVTSLSTDTTPNGEGWRDSNTTVILAPSDAMSGTAETKYRIRNFGETWGMWKIYSLPLVISDGEWVIEYHSTDLSDNEESHKTGTVRIDTVNPEASISTNTIPNSKNWRNNTTVVTLICSDTNPHKLTYKIVNRDSSLGGDNWTDYCSPFNVPDGKWGVKYYSIDKAGNDSSVGSIDLNVDTYAPTCVVLKPERDSVQTGFTSEQMCEVVGLGSDENGVDYQKLSVENLTVKEQNKAGEMSYIWDVGTLEEGFYDIKVEAVDPAGNSSSSSKNISLGNYCRDWYFAEGNTLPEFDQFFCIQNPGDQIAKVTFNFMLETGETVTHDVVIGPQTRSTYNIKEFVEEGHHVSTHIRSDGQAIIAERPMYFNYKNSQGTQWKGGHIAMGLNSLQKEFYFAEGTTRRNETDGIFDEWLTIQNPSDDTANVKITHMLGTGQNIEIAYQIIPHSRYTVNVPNDVGLQQDVSTKIESDVPIAAERPMYFDYHGFAQEGHNVVGIPSPSKTWYFAEGSTQAGFEEWITIQNPNNEDAKLKFKYMTSTGEIIEKDKEVPKRSRYTVDVPMDAGKGKDTSVEITSDVPVVCERPMYFNYKGKWTGGTNVMGATTLSDTFYIAEGTTIENFDTYYTAANPSNDSVEITIKYMFGDGKTEEKDYTIEAHARLTINVNSEIGGGKDVSSEIKTSGGSKIMVERPMYFDYHGMSGGHVVNAYGVN